MHVTWHGHSTWHVEVGSTELLVDPFFGNPKTEMAPEDVGTPDAVLVTHGHDDHVGHVGAFAETTVAGTPEVVGRLAEQHGIAEEDALGFNMGGTVEIGDAYVTMHRADHTNGMGEGFVAPSGGPPAGYIISDTKPTQLEDEDSTTFYHTGDTGLMTEMRDVIGPFLEPDAVAVPIGDHFTMGPMQAAVAVDWLNVDYAFPMHYDTFPPIEQDPQDFANEVAGTGSDAEVVVLDGDESYGL